MTDLPDFDQEEPEGEPEQETLNFDELLARFKEKMAAIPPECHAAMGWLYVYRQIQDERKRLANRAIQMTEGKRVFWAHVLPPDALLPMAANIQATVDQTAPFEEQAATALHSGRVKDKEGKWHRVSVGLKNTSWYQEVAIPASRGVGMSEGSGTLSAAKILWAFGAASRFESFGKIVRYARLAPENGKAPGRAKGKRIHYNPGAWQALFDLSETWNRMPDSPWRIMWDAFKIQLTEQHPDYPKGRIHNMARRKVLREFLRELYDLWIAWEARQ